MNPATDLRTLVQLFRGQSKEGDHAQRLERFYAPQADGYDAFRDRLLSGRESLIDLLDLPDGSRVVELGCGTGRNLDFFGDRVGAFASVDLVDVCNPLLDQARRRAARWPSIVRVMQADAELYRPANPVDCVYLSYSLSMTANWKKAICNAVRMLRPGGILGVVDFYVSEASPPPGRVRHGRFTREFWPRWFSHDGVNLTPEHLRSLADFTDRVHLEEKLAPLPWLPMVRVPYYIHIGRKRPNDRRRY